MVILQKLVLVANIGGALTIKVKSRMVDGAMQRGEDDYFLISLDFFYCCSGGYISETGAKGK